MHCQRLTEVGKDGTEEQKPPCLELSRLFEPKEIIMNARLLFVATIALSLASSYVLADDSSVTLTRDQVTAQILKARADGTLQRTDYDTGTVVPAASTRTRADTYADLAAAKANRKVLVGPDANRTYNPSDIELYAKSSVTRAEVKAGVLQAAASGTLQRTDYDDQAAVARRSHSHQAGSVVAQRIKATLPGSAG